MIILNIWYWHSQKRNALLHLPPPPPIESLGTYARSPSPEPPISGKGYTHYLRYRLPLAITKNSPFPGLFREIFRRLRPQNTPFPKKMGTRMRPSYTFEGGGGTYPVRGRQSRPMGLASTPSHRRTLTPLPRWWTPHQLSSLKKERKKKNPLSTGPIKMSYSVLWKVMVWKQFMQIQVSSFCSSVYIKSMFILGVPKSGMADFQSFAILTLNSENNLSIGEWRWRFWNMTILLLHYTVFRQKWANLRPTSTQKLLKFGVDMPMCNPLIYQSCRKHYTGWPKKKTPERNSRFSGLCSDQQLSFFHLAG